MELTVLTTLFEPGRADDFLAAAAQATEPDEAEIAALCARLTGIEGDDPDVIADGLLAYPAPRGFLHARVFDAADGIEIASVFRRDGHGVTAEQISLLVTLSEPFLDGVWVETKPLPVRDPGVLDLLVRFEPRSA